ncbi:hypothetical protein ACFLVP_00845 [Chloroflexota bacterium]
MAIEDHLTSTEDIVDTIKCAHRVKYYVTNKRIIRHFHSMAREEMDDLLSSHITSISLCSVARKGMIYIGIALLVIGFVAYALNYFLSFIDSSYYNYACYGLVGVGFLLVILGFILKVAFYQFVASGMPEEIAARWRIMGVGAHEARDFIKAVRESIF